MIIGSYTLHTLPVFYTNTFSQETITKIQHKEVNLEEATNLRALCKTTPTEKIEHEVQKFIFIAPGDTQPSPTLKSHLPKSSKKTVPPKTLVTSTQDKSQKTPNINLQQ